jgi:hypothetical protein
MSAKVMGWKFNLTGWELRYIDLESTFTILHYTQRNVSIRFETLAAGSRKIIAEVSGIAVTL